MCRQQGEIVDIIRFCVCACFVCMFVCVCVCVGKGYFARLLFATTNLLLKALMRPGLHQILHYGVQRLDYRSNEQQHNWAKKNACTI